MASCSMYAVIKDKNGNNVESKLHEALVGAFKSYDEANRYYNAITSPEFKNTEIYKSLEFDEYGEPTFESLYNNGMFYLIDASKLARSKQKEIGASRTEYGANDSTIDLYKKANEFNQKKGNEDFLAVVFYDEATNEHYIKVIKRDRFRKNTVKERVRSMYDALSKIQDLIKDNGNNLMRQIFTEMSKRSGFLDIKNNSDFKDMNGEDILSVFYNIISDLSGKDVRGSAGNMHKEHDPMYTRVLAEAIMVAYDDVEGTNNIITRLINACDDNVNSDAKIFYEEGGLGYDMSPDETAANAIVLMLNGGTTGITAVDNLLHVLKGNLQRASLGIANNSEFDAVVNRIRINKDRYQEGIDPNVTTQESLRLSRLSYELKDMAKEANGQVNEMQKYLEELEEVYDKIITLEERRMTLIKEIKPNKDDKDGIANRKRMFQHQKELLVDLDNSIMAKREAYGILSYLSDVSEQVAELIDKMDSADNITVPIKEKAKLLNEANELMESYKDILSDIRVVMNDNKGGFISKVEQESKGMLRTKLERVIQLYDSYSKDKDKDEAIENIRKVVNNIDIGNDIESSLEEINKFLERYKGIPDYRSAGMYQRKLEDVESVMNTIELIKTASKESTFSRKISALSDYLDKTTVGVENLEAKFKKMALPVFATFLEEFQDDKAKVVKFGEYMGFKAGETISVEEILKRIDSDVNYYQRLFSSLANAPDMILGLTDKAIKSIKEEARMDLMEDVESIKREAKLLEEAGIYDTEWLFERDDKGKKTGYYVTSSLRQNAINLALKDDEVIKRLKLIPGETPNLSNLSKDDRIWFNKKVKAISSALKSSNIENKQYKEIMSNPAKKRFYEFFMKIYDRLQGYYPPSATKANRIIGIRKDNMDIIMNTEGVKNKAHEVWEVYLDQFRDTNDDENSGVRLDLQGKEVKRLPIYFCNFKQEEVDMQSEDCVSNLLCYAAKAHEYSKMNEFIDFLEVGREVLKTRRIDKKAAGKNMIEKLDKFTDKLRTKKGKKTRSEEKNDEDEESKGDIISEIDGGTSNIFYMYETALNMRVYGKPRKNEGTFGNTNISKGKVANWINKRTAEGALAFSLANGISNVMTGTVMMRIESWTNQFFSAKDTIWADATYGKEVLSYLAEKSSRIKTNKLSLFGELFDVQYEYTEDVNNTRWNKSNWFKRLMTSGTVTQVLQNAGEHWMAFRTALSLAHNTSHDIYLLDKDGNKVNVWDSFETKYMDKDGNLVDTDQGYGAKFIIKEGLKTKDGVALDNTEEGKKALAKFVFDFKRKVGAINHGMHGIYNTEDANAIQQYALGRLAYMFRKWIPAAIHKRFGSTMYDYDMQEWTEGYYTTCWRVLGQLYDELKGMKNFRLVFKGLSNEEKVNIKRAMIEISSFIAISLFCMYRYSKNGGDDDKEKDKSWLNSFIKYQAFRLKSELGSLIPWIEMPQEAIRIFKSPAAGLNLADNSLQILYALRPYNWGLFTDEDDDGYLIKRGFWKGHSKGFKYVFGNKLLFPKANVLINNASISEKIGFYMNN